MERDTNKSIEIKNTQEQGVFGPLQLFSGNESFIFVFKKTQKLVSALYLITGFFQDNEPLKWRLRTLGSELLSLSLLLRDDSSKGKDSTIVSMRANILEVTSLLSVSKQIGLISDMNYGIINKEFDVLSLNLNLSADAYSGSNSSLNEGFFHVDRNLKSGAERVTLQDSFLKPVENVSLNNYVVKPKQELLDEKDYLISNRTEQSFKGHLQQADKKMHAGKASEVNDLKEFGVVAVKKNSRQSTIIALLKRKKEIMIKDVSPLIDGCSEKTIQRELLSMVQSGILRKHGEKRWSRYSLVRP
ncbi:MAG: hypothetical protein AB200_01890 [Parcubacteria bacterium C7867-005]|nr:MAG: hypothetical protein AB200_01890 [Parcubacteria bacterium C7867-005]